MFVINSYESQIIVFLALSRDELPVSFKILIGAIRGMVLVQHGDHSVQHLVTDDVLPSALLL